MIGIYYPKDWSGPMLPSVFAHMLVTRTRIKRDVEIHLKMLLETEQAACILIDAPNQRHQIILGLPIKWRPEVAAHEFAHVLQYLGEEHLSKTEETLEHEANTFEAVWGKTWDAPAPQVSDSASG